jgi:hypothetical protein
MKKAISTSMAVLLLFVGSITSSCMGSWGLTKGLYQWNEDATGNRFVDNLIFWVLGFVYAATISIDFLILNLIEFWTGSNPIGMAPGEMEEQEVSVNGANYHMQATQNQMVITALTGEKAGHVETYVYKPELKTWMVSVNGNELTPMLSARANDQGQLEAMVYTEEGIVTVPTGKFMFH